MDNALRVVELLATAGSLRVVEVSEHLGVARSTAHRILTALLARGFVVQDAHKVYHTGPVFERLRHGGGAGPQTTNDIIHDYLMGLVGRVGETCHVGVLEGNGIRFVDSIEASRALRVGSRVGMLLPAHVTAIGTVLLAELPKEKLRALYPRGLTGSAREARQTLTTLDRKIRSVRRTGYALNRGESDHGIAAIGMCLRDPFGRAFAGIAIAVPTPRYEEVQAQRLITELANTVTAVQRTLAAYNRSELIGPSGGTAPLAM